MAKITLKKNQLMLCANILFFFALGFNYFLLYFPFLIISLLFSCGFLFNFRLTKYFFWLIILFFSFLFFLFSFGFENLINGFQYQIVVVFFISVGYGGYLFQRLGSNERLLFLTSYIFGFYSKSILIVLFSFYTDPILYGYGKLINPLNLEELNSPGVSNSIALCSVFFLLLFTLKSFKFFVNLSLILFVFFSFICGIFLAGRTFFLILFLASFYILYFKFKIEYFFKMSIISFAAILFLYNNDYLLAKLSFVIDRFDSGLSSSSRFEHFFSALERIPNYPFGGFKVDSNIENTYWFHNLFMDVASLGGWIPLLLLIFYFIYSFLLFLFSRSNKNDIRIGFGVFSFSFLIMMQDVVFEGNFQLLIISFLSTLLFLKSTWKVIP